MQCLEPVSGSSRKNSPASQHGHKRQNQKEEKIQHLVITASVNKLTTQHKSAGVIADDWVARRIKRYFAYLNEFAEVIYEKDQSVKRKWSQRDIIDSEPIS